MSLYEDAGGDVNRCEWDRGLDGAGAHVECIERFINRKRRR